MMKYNSLKGLYYTDNDLWKETYEKRINGDGVYKFNIGDDKDFFVVITPDILERITRILGLDKNLFAIASELPRSAKSNYTKMCIIEEIKGTNDIEGVKSTRKEISIILSNLETTKRRRLHGLISKYALLFKDDEEIENVEDIRRVYDEMILDEVVEEEPEHMPDGVIFRKDIVRVRNSSRKVIHYGLPTEEEVIKAMNKVIDIMKDKEINFLIKIAVVHYLIGYIHPFYDGNGRLARYIASMQLCKELEPIVGYKIAYTIKSNLPTYLKMFSEANIEYNCRDLTNFVEKFLDFIIVDIEEAIEAMVDAKMKLDYFEIKIKELELCDKEEKIYMALLDNSLFDAQGADIKAIKSEYGYSETFIRKVLNDGISKNLISGQKIGKKLFYKLNLDEIDNFSI